MPFADFSRATAVTDFNAAYLSAAQLDGLPFGGLGADVLIDSSVRIVGIENLRIGSHSRIDAGTIIVASGPVSIGSHVHIGAHCYLQGRGGIRIGDFANVSSFVGLHSVSDDPSGTSLTNPTVPDAYKTLDIGEIVLGRHALVYTKSTLLPGTTLGEGAVIGALSLAGGDIPEWTIHAGVPARFLKARARDVLDLERKFLRSDGPA